MDEDWAVDVRKHAPGADPGVIAGIVRYCGIALRNRDSALVSFSDPAETGRVRENYLKKKLGVTDPDASLDTAIAAVGHRMQGDTTRNRVTVYYLLAEHFGKLGLFGGAAAGATAGAATPAAGAGTPAAGAGTPAAAGAAPVGTGAASSAGTAPVLPVAVPSRGIIGGSDAYPARGAPMSWLPLAVLAIIGLLLFVAVPGAPDAVAPVVAAEPAPAPVVDAAPAVPAGSGVVSQQVESKPLVSVYFDTAETDVSPEFAAAAAELKAYLDGNAGSKLAVSGYNDPTGNAAFNAELSKKRAVAVRDALVAAGIPEASIDLVKPEETTDASTTPENARRVDVKIA